MPLCWPVEAARIGDEGRLVARIEVPPVLWPRIMSCVHAASLSAFAAASSASRSARASALALAIADAGAYPEEKFHRAFAKAFMGLYKNPIFIGLAIGLVVRFTGMPIPDVIQTVIGYLTATAPVVALFVVGGTVANFPIKTISIETSMIAVGKLVFHPLLVTFGMLAFPMADPAYMLGAALFASVPMLSIYPIFGQRYGIESITATTLVFTTTLSFFTVSALIYLMG